ncbi:MAG: hypothetical protein JNL38_16945 [Myxococcales bacterium]|nr:hypothetical protein [Myxococcales bacterium]
MRSPAQADPRAPTAAPHAPVRRPSEPRMKRPDLPSAVASAPAAAPVAVLRRDAHRLAW